MSLRRWLNHSTWSAAVVLPAVTALVWGSAPFAPPARAAAGGPLTAGHLTVDGATDPLGTDNPAPALGWQLRASAGRVPADGAPATGESSNGQRQSAYRVLVADDARKLGAGQGNVWDSGRIRSADSTGVSYGGPKLTSSRTYYWKVQVWDAHGAASAWSPTARWETGLLGAGDWQGARWISPDTGSAHSWSDFTLDTDFTIKSGAASVLFRAKDARNFYLWQINTASSPGKVVLRPQVQLDGAFSTLGETDLSSVITQADVHTPHHLRVEAHGSTFTTWVDGTEVDSRTNDALTKGTLGFRTSTTAGVTEDALYDNVEVHGPDGAALFQDGFGTSPDPLFPGTAITDGQLQPKDGVTLLNSEPDAPMLRKTFTLPGKKVASARAYVYGLGFYELHLNGGKVGDHVLAPSATPYDQRNAYATYDVTGDLRQGANAVGLWLGNGYGPKFSPYGFRWTGPKQAVMALKVRYTDGTSQDITTDDSWRWSSGAITGNDLYAGESFDAGLDRAGWDRPGFDAAGWQPVRTVTAPSARLTADTMPPLRVTGTLRAAKLSEPEPGVYVYDFGQDIAGWERLRVRGAAGTRVRMRTAEEVGADGMLDTATNRAAAATDTYTLAGKGATETYEPRFTYHGFRYLEVTGFPGKPRPGSVDARVVHADVASTGSFTSSDPLLNQIWRNNRWSILNNSMSLPTDNPVRDERTPPGMDVQAYHDASTREFGMDSYYAKYLKDMPPGTALPNDAANAQQPDMGGDQITLAWTLYEQYGDRATLASAYPAMKTFVDTNAKDVPGHIWPADRGFGDWCPPDRSAAANGGQGGPDAGDCTSEVPVVNTALSYLQALDVAKSARALGHGTDAAHFTALAADIKGAFNTEFLNAAGDTYGDGRQTTSVLPLAFGMVPAADVDKVGRQLVDTVLTKDGGHLDTGIFGTRYLVDALAAAGRTDVAMTVLDQRDYPGFGYEIGRGATSSWEQWTYSSNMETHDHAMFAGINASLYTKLGGIEPTGPGYRALKVDPELPAGLRHAAASLDTVRGRVATSWTVTGGRLSLDVTVPVGSTATVAVPRSAAHGAHAPHGAKPVRGTGGKAAYSVGSGHWHFTGAGPAAPPRPARR
ncbi:family 78 glycoside hydrolase catalytic domain [Streptomyces sp. NBC_00859]|uniref:family 78 glycoside hydrolase catalytic domain n=1 Tax=Streptomyces sp. NBC_00859 TaxID=2903682 RepID=UPI003865CE48|nr:glycoside hydrolase family 78 protein [Streptomyces sp. NBC_00859]